MGAGSQDVQGVGDASSRSFDYMPRPSFGSSSRSLHPSADHQSACPYTVHTPSFRSSAPSVERIFLPDSPSPWNCHPASPLAGFANIAQSLQQAAAASSQKSQDCDVDGTGSVTVQNLHVHFHSPCTVGAGGGIQEEYERHIGWRPGPADAFVAANTHHQPRQRNPEPLFAVASSAQGIDFGRKFTKRLYRAVKHVDQYRNVITYTQSPSAMQTLSLALTLGMSTKRSKHAIFLFDSGPPQHLAHSWPLHIHLRDITCIIRSLGASFDYTRTKVKKTQFSLYIFGIKQRGTKLSDQGIQMWYFITGWAQNLLDDVDNSKVSLFLSSLGNSQESIFRQDNFAN